jgi:Nuclear pore protein 84 / 107
VSAVHGKVSAARALHKRVSSSRIVSEKREYILGTKNDTDGNGNSVVSKMAARSATSGSNGALNASSRNNSDDEQVLERTIASESPFLDLEKLVTGLSALNEWRSLVEVRPKYVMTRIISMIEQLTNNRDREIQKKKDWKRKLEKAYETVIEDTEPLLGDWLLAARTDGELNQTNFIRGAYLPEVVLALHGVHMFAGQHLSSDKLTQCLNLATLVAAPNSALLDPFQRSNKLKKFLDAIKESSKAVLITNDQRKGKVGKEKKRGAGAGETLGIWQVTPPHNV